MYIIAEKEYRHHGAIDYDNLLSRDAYEFQIQKDKKQIIPRMSREFSRLFDFYHACYF